MSSPHSPSTMNDNEEEMLFHPPPPLHIISTQAGAPSPIEGSPDDCVNEEHALKEPSHEQHQHDDQEATEEVNQQQQPTAPRPQERPNKIRLKFDPSAATAAAASPQSDDVPVIPAPRRLKVALKGNPVSLVVKKHHHDVDASLSAEHHHHQSSPVDTPHRGGSNSAAVHESLLVTPLQTARSVLQTVLCEFDENNMLRTLLANITTPAVATQPPPRGRKAPSSSSSHHQLPSLQRQGVSDPYFLHVGDEDGCDAVREELLQWHLGLAKWRYNYWYTTRRPPHSSKSSSHHNVVTSGGGNNHQALDEVFLASIHIQRLVEWKLHMHSETSAFVLTPPTAHALYALDLGWSNDASREFREPVDTVQYPSYLDFIGGVPCCLADLYDYVRGGAPEPLISVIAKPLVTLSLVAAMDLISSNCKAFNGASSDFLKDWVAARNTIQRELKSSQARAVITRTDGSILSLADAERKMHAWFPRRVHAKHPLQVAPHTAVPIQVTNTKRGASRRGAFQVSSAQPAQGHEVVNVDHEEDEISLVARREAQLSAPDTWARKETIVVRGKVFEQLHDKWVECGSCLKWRLVPYDASKFKTWNCEMIERECGGADDELVGGVGVMGSARATNKKRGPYKKKEQQSATLVDDEEVDTIPDKKRGKKQKPAAPLVDDEEGEAIPDKKANRRHSKRDRNLPDRMKHDKSETRRDRERARLLKQKGVVATSHVSNASKRHHRSRVDDSDDTTSSPSSDSETDSTASSSSMSSSSSAPPAKKRPTSRKEVHKAVAAVVAPSAATRTSASTAAGGGSTADHAGLQELLATFNATAITRRGDATDAQLLKRLRDLAALEGKLKDLQKNGAR